VTVAVSGSTLTTLLEVKSFAGFPSPSDSVAAFFKAL
jgi:hypothetical protein